MKKILTILLAALFCADIASAQPAARRREQAQQQQQQEPVSYTHLTLPTKA